MWSRLLDSAPPDGPPSTPSKGANSGFARLRAARIAIAKNIVGTTGDDQSPLHPGNEGAISASDDRPKKATSLRDMQGIPGVSFLSFKKNSPTVTKPLTREEESAEHKKESKALQRQILVTGAEAEATQKVVDILVEQGSQLRLERESIAVVSRSTMLAAEELTTEFTEIVTRVCAQKISMRAIVAATLSEKRATIEKLETEKEAAEQASELFKKSSDSVISQKDAEIANLETANVATSAEARDKLAQRDAKIREGISALAHTEKALAQKDEVIKEKEKAFRELDAAVAQKDAELLGLRTSNDEVLAELANLRKFRIAQLAEQDQERQNTSNVEKSCPSSRRLENDSDLCKSRGTVFEEYASSPMSADGRQASAEYDDMTSLANEGADEGFDDLPIRKSRGDGQNRGFDDGFDDLSDKNMIDEGFNDASDEDDFDDGFDLEADQFNSESDEEDRPKTLQELQLQLPGDATSRAAPRLESAVVSGQEITNRDQVRREDSTFSCEDAGVDFDYDIGDDLEYEDANDIQGNVATGSSDSPLHPGRGQTTPPATAQIDDDDSTLPREDSTFSCAYTEDEGDEFSATARYGRRPVAREPSGKLGPRADSTFSCADLVEETGEDEELSAAAMDLGERGYSTYSCAEVVEGDVENYIQEDVPDGVETADAAAPEEAEDDVEEEDDVEGFRSMSRRAMSTASSVYSTMDDEVEQIWVNEAV